MKKRAPVLGGSFALWAGLFASTECLLIHLRNKEDFMNPIAAGFFTGGLLAARGFIKYTSWFKSCFKKCCFWRNYIRLHIISRNWDD